MTDDGRRVEPALAGEKPHVLDEMGGLHGQRRGDAAVEEIAYKLIEVPVVRLTRGSGQAAFNPYVCVESTCCRGESAFARGPTISRQERRFPRLGTRFRALEADSTLTSRCR
jgi:hypothetical protein